MTDQQIKKKQKTPPTAYGYDLDILHQPDCSEPDGHSFTMSATGD